MSALYSFFLYSTLSLILLFSLILLLPLLSKEVLLERIDEDGYTAVFSSVWHKGRSVVERAATAMATAMGNVMLEDLEMEAALE